MPWLTLSGSNYPCLERISMVPKMFEPLRFDCKWLVKGPAPSSLTYLCRMDSSTLTRRYLISLINTMFCWNFENLMQTEYIRIRRRVLRRLIWVYTAFQCPFYGTLGINRLRIVIIKLENTEQTQERGISHEIYLKPSRLMEQKIRSCPETHIRSFSASLTVTTLCAYSKFSRRQIDIFFILPKK